MRIIKLKAKNIKGLKEVEIKPGQNLVLVTGKNGHGKTSLLDSIMYALGGGSVIEDKPIRDGEDKAEVELDLGDLIVKRRWTESGTYLDVKTKEGAKYPKAQAKLDKLTDSLYFDPLEFMRQSAKDQKKILLKALGVDLTAEQNEYADIYDERRMVGREMKIAQAKIKDVEVDEKLIGQEKKSVSEASSKLEETNKEITEAKRKQERLAEITEQIKKLEKERDQLAEDIKEVSITDLEQKRDEYRETMETAEKVNEQIEKANRYSEMKKEADKKAQEYEKMTQRLEEIEEAKEEKLKKANPPKGIKVTEDGLLYNDIPLAQLSGAEKLRLSLEIATKIDKDLKVIRITDGSLLDEQGLSEVEKTAIENDYQVWVEIVKNEDDGIGIYLEEGEVK